MLTDNFTDFYTSETLDSPKYLYLVWSLWLYLCAKEKELFEKYPDATEIPIYGKMPIKTDDKIISLNYTCAAKKSFPKNEIIYFHGNLENYISPKSRETISFVEKHNSQKSKSSANVDFDEIDKKEILETLDLKQEKFIPEMMPPLTIKPALSNEYIDTWYAAKNAIGSADEIISIGYSFSNSDEHFNSLLKNRVMNNEKVKLKIVCPNAETIKNKKFHDIKNVDIFNGTAQEYIDSL